MVGIGAAEAGVNRFEVEVELDAVHSISLTCNRALEVDERQRARPAAALDATYAEGAVLGKSLRWKLWPSRARALGKLEEPKNDRTMPRGGRLVLSRPVDSCGRRVFSRVEYRIKTPRRTIREQFPIYTC